MNGGDTIFYENGKIQFLRNWNHGVLDGYIRKWDENGVHQL
jgi:antitoxin component YwqK of YwqJK toxin-antitoxin module